MPKKKSSNVAKSGRENGTLSSWPNPPLNVAPRYHESLTENGKYSAPVAGYLARVDVTDEEFWKYPQPFKNGETVFVFGDIAHMPGHCVIATKDGKVHYAYHTDNFVKLTDEEV